MRKEYTYGDVETAICITETYIQCFIPKMAKPNWFNAIEVYRENNGVYEVRARFIEFAQQLETAWKRLSNLKQEKIRETIGYAFDFEIIPWTIEACHQFAVNNSTNWWNLNSNTIGTFWLQALGDE